MGRLDHRTRSGSRAREVRLTLESLHFNPPLAPTADAVWTSEDGAQSQFLRTHHCQRQAIVGHAPGMGRTARKEGAKRQAIVCHSCNGNRQINLIVSNHMSFDDLVTVYLYVIENMESASDWRLILHACCQVLYFVGIQQRNVPLGWTLL